MNDADFFPLVQQSEACFNAISVFGYRPDQDDLAQRRILRETFRPMVIDLFDRQQDAPAALQSPEDILRTTAGSLPESEAALNKEITATYCQPAPEQPPRDWLAEADRIIISVAEKQDHPLLRLGKVVKGRMSPRAIRSLAASSMAQT